MYGCYVIYIFMCIEYENTKNTNGLNSIVLNIEHSEWI